MWEKRYEAVVPERTETQRRLYSEEDIERLRMLRIATESGHRIGDVARLPSEQLRDLTADRLRESLPLNRGSSWSSTDAVAEALAAVGQYDGGVLENVLNRSAILFGTHGVLQNVIAPLAHRVGKAWKDGDMTAAHEHFATDQIRYFLHKRSNSYGDGESMPVMIVATPAGQLHELGAAIATTAARDAGWHVEYLGANLPAAEIAGTAVQRNAKAVGLSIVYPADDQNLPHELRTLRKLLPPEIRIVAGGQAASSYASSLQEIGAIICGGLGDYYSALERFRSSPGRSE
jgi:methylmalonyl-CoA mutase cobalamin-binding domain/chain